MNITRITKWAAIAAVASLGLFSVSADDESGFKKIFNGKDLSGWDGNPKLWTVKDGTIVGETFEKDPLKQNTFLIWKEKEPADFELRFTYRIRSKVGADFANSGVQYRSKVYDPQNWVVGGYQADFEAGKKFSGILYEERESRGIMAERGQKVVFAEDGKKEVVGSVGNSDEIQAKIKSGEWNEYVISAKGNHLVHKINGLTTVDVTDNDPKNKAEKGVLAFQLHVGPPMILELKNVRIKELN